MKVGTDGVLLGAWVSIEEGCRRVLDIGTGTGLIALMVAQRTEKMEKVESVEALMDGVLIDGVEIDEESAAQARENVERSEWGSRVSIYHSDIQSFHSSERGELIEKNDSAEKNDLAKKYDLIVTNPPYFVDSLKSPNSSRTIARHTTDLSFRDLALAAVRLLNPDGGRFALILPVAESKLFDAEALGRLVLVRRCEVFSREGSPAKRVMSEYTLSKIQGRSQTESFSGSKTGSFSESLTGTQFRSHKKTQSSKEILSQITIESGNPPQFTEEYKTLTRDFYLKF